MEKLGELKRVDIRSVWEHEARDFTPWLRDHIELLAKAVGLDLDLVEAESPVGDYAVDLYAKDLNTGRWVIIENQLEQTDHNHMGQLMAYAAGKEAGVVVWVSPKFRDEHRQTLDWLNEITDDSVSFFGIEVEVFQIDSSRRAPHLNVVAQPSEWRRVVAGPAVSRRQLAYQAFFSDLLEKVKAQHPNLTSARKAYPQSWFSYPVGRSGFGIGTVFTRDKLFRVELYIDIGDQAKNKAAFDELYKDREHIEAKIGQPLVWERLDERRASRVSCGVAGTIDDELEHLEELQDWAVDLVATFRKVFRPRVQKLKM
jgi:hypothetical protein